MTKENIVEKIQKILNLAKNNSSQQESEVAMMKAQELLLKYDLTMGDIFEVEEKIAEENIGRISKDKLLIASALSPFFRVTFLRQRNRRERAKYGVCVGHKSDIAVFRNVFDFCWIYFKKSREEFVTFYLYQMSVARHTGDNLEYKYGQWVEKEVFKTTKREIENNYMTGFIAGIVQKFSENVNKFALQIRKTVQHEEKLKEMNLQYKNVRTAKRENPFIIRAGINDGLNFKKKNAEVTSGQ
jgi:hypothetical protein